MFALTLAVFAIGAQRAHAQERIGEASFLTRLEAALPELELMRAQLDVERAKIHRAKVRSPLGLSVDREEVFSGGEGFVQKSSVVLDWRVDLSSRRELGIESAADRVEAREQRNERERQLLRLDALRLFYRALHAQERVTSLEASRRPLATLVHRLERQVQEGQASGLDLRRFALQLAEHDGELLDAKSEARIQQVTIGTLLGLDEHASLVLVGTLDLPALTESTGTVRADLRAAQHEIDAARRLQRAAGQWWIPSVDLSAGYMFTDLGPGTGPGAGIAHGYVAGIRVELPFFGERKAAAAEAKATLRRSEASLRLLERSQLAETRAGRLRVEHCREHFQRMQTTQVAPTRELLERTEAAYLGGEGSALELRDAFRRNAEIGLRLLSLRLECKEAELSLRRSTATSPQGR